MERGPAMQRLFAVTAPAVLVAAGTGPLAPGAVAGGGGCQTDGELGTPLE